MPGEVAEYYRNQSRQEKPLMELKAVPAEFRENIKESFKIYFRHRETEGYNGYGFARED